MTPEEREKEMLDFVTDQLLEAVAAPIKGAIAESRENVRRQARREALEKACKAQCDKCSKLGLSTYDTRLREWGHHGYEFARCGAVYIRALMERED